MSIFQEFNDFIGEIKAIGNELDSTKRGVISSLVDSATEVKSTLTDTAQELKTTAQQVGGELRQTVNASIEPPQSTSDDDQVSP